MAYTLYNHTIRKVDLLIRQVLGWMAGSGSKEVTLCCLSRNLWHIVQVLFSHFCFIFLHNIGYGLIKWVEVTAVITDITYNNSSPTEIPRGKESPFNSCIKNTTIKTVVNEIYDNFLPRRR